MAHGGGEDDTGREPSPRQLARDEPLAPRQDGGEGDERGVGDELAIAGLVPREPLVLVARADPAKSGKPPKNRTSPSAPLTNRCASPNRLAPALKGWRVIRSTPCAAGRWAGAPIELGAACDGMSPATTSAKARSINTKFTGSAIAGAPTVYQSTGPACLCRANTPTSATNQERTASE